MNSIPQKKVLDGIASNTDTYKLSDINCFYKPMGIIHKYFKEDYGSLFLCLMSAYCIFVQEDPFVYYDEFYNRVFSDLFSLRIEKKKIKNKQDMVDDIVRSIYEETPVIVEVDQYYLYYSEHYKSEHVYHYIPIKGYDSTKDIFFCLDILHDDNRATAIYKDDVITSDILWYAFTGDKYYVFKPIAPLREYNQIKDSYLKLYKEFYAKRRLTIETFKNRDIFQFQNTRVVYYSELIQFLYKVYQDKDVCDEIKNEKEELIKKWEKTKLLAIYKNEKEDTHKQFSFIDSFSEAENEFHKKIFSLVL